MITVKLNDKSYQIEEGTTLAAFIQSLNLIPKGLAIAIDYSVIPKDKWNETILSDGIELMLIHAVSGG